MKNLFELTNDIYYAENYSVSVEYPYAGYTRTDFHANKTIVEAMEICEAVIVSHPLGEVTITCADTGEIIYQRKATEGDLPKSTNVYTYNVIFNHLAELLENGMEF